MNIDERIVQLRHLMKERHIDAYVVPSADFHQSEYVGDYFKAREFISGFTGSAGTVVVTRDAAGLWTDGRYFIQAATQIKGTQVKLFKMGNQGVSTVKEFLQEKLPHGGVLGFDGRLVAMQEGRDWEETFQSQGIRFHCDEDLVGNIWDDRPSLSREAVFVLENRYSGESSESKLLRIREAMKARGANRLLIASLDDLAWILNIRGRDVLYSPLVLGYAVISLDDADLFIDGTRLSDAVKEYLTGLGAICHDYNDIYEWLSSLGKKDVMWVDPDRINYALYKTIPSSVKRVEEENPAVLWKAMKNPVELENIHRAHIKDGVAGVKLMYWLKTQFGKIPMSEISVSEKLEEFRADQDGYLWPSFEPISAFGAHAAMMHYAATSETDLPLESGAFLLMDTGGNYLEGSTDITRTFALGEVNDGLKRDFTAVLRANLNLSRAKFLYGCHGYNLDVLAREPIWALEMDYKCGTGHGVGYLLNIHEGPSGFRWYVVPSKHETHPLEAGMVITDEPGIYVENSHGIRLENELIIRQGVENEAGQFMYMEPITYVPFDLDAIDIKALSRDEREYLNAYHKKVYELISPYLDEKERVWLALYTRAL